MIILNLVQGTPEWNETRAKYFTASEASIMMAASASVKRSELLRMKATGTEREFSDWFQRNILDKGHEVEEAARPLAEQIIGEELYPVTALDDAERFLASFDGITMLEDVAWECKQWNEEKAADVRSGKVPDCDYWQVVQQLHVSQAEKALYMVTDGTPENTVHVWAYPNQDDVKTLITGWEQFAADLESYTPEELKPEPVGRNLEELPALVVDISGEVRASNLPEFKDRALAMIASVKTELVTDQDFADAEKAIKAFDKAEKQLEATKKAALEQTASIDELFKTVDHLKAEMRDKRLLLNRTVKAEKENRRAQIIEKADKAFTAWLNQQESPTPVNVHFAPAIAMKGKKTIASLQSAADDALAAAKVEAKQQIDLFKSNLSILEAKGKDHRFLFSDWKQLIGKQPEDLGATITARIAEHERREQEKLEAERERIRQQEEAKAKAEAERKVREEQRIQQEHASKQRAIDERLVHEHVERMEQAASPATPVSERREPPAQLHPHELVDVAAEDTVTISRAEYEQLLAAQAKLHALEGAGVDNWTGYDDAMEALAAA